MIYLGCESDLKWNVISYLSKGGCYMLPFVLGSSDSGTSNGERSDEQIWKEGGKGGQMKAPCCSNSPLGWRGILRGLTWWKRALVRVNKKRISEGWRIEMKRVQEKSRRMQKNVQRRRRVGVGRVIFQWTRVWYDVLLSLLFLFATSHRGLLLYPLQSCSGTYGGCHSTPQPITPVVLGYEFIPFHK